MALLGPHHCVALAGWIVVTLYHVVLFHRYFRALDEVFTLDASLIFLSILLDVVAAFLRTDCPSVIPRLSNCRAVKKKKPCYKHCEHGPVGLHTFHFISCSGLLIILHVLETDKLCNVTGNK